MDFRKKFWCSRFLAAVLICFFQHSYAQSQAGQLASPITAPVAYSALEHGIPFSYLAKIDGKNVDPARRLKAQNTVLFRDWVSFFETDPSAGAIQSESHLLQVLEEKSPDMFLVLDMKKRMVIPILVQKRVSVPLYVEDEKSRKKIHLGYRQELHALSLLTGKSTVFNITRYTGSNLSILRLKPRDQGVTPPNKIVVDLGTIGSSDDISEMLSAQIREGYLIGMQKLFEPLFTVEVELKEPQDSFEEFKAKPYSCFSLSR